MRGRSYAGKRIQEMLISCFAYRKSCKHSFCPTHRHPKDHLCTAPSTSAVPLQAPKPAVPSSFPRFSLKNNVSKSSNPPAASSKPTSAPTSLLTPSGNPRKDAALAAIKRSLQKKSESSGNSGANGSAKEVVVVEQKGKPTLASVMQSFQSGSSPSLSK